MKPKQHDDWLLDIRLYSEEFRADLVSLQMEELLVEPSSAMRKTMKLYSKFFNNIDRKAKLRRIGRTYQTPLQLHIDIMAVLCGISGGSVQDIIVAVLSAGLEKESNDALINIDKFGNIEAFWQNGYIRITPWTYSRARKNVTNRLCHIPLHGKLAKHIPDINLMLSFHMVRENLSI